MSDAEESTDYEDVDDVIGLAERMQQKQESALTDEELEEVGAELGIEPEFVEKAREELASRREQKERERERRRERRRKWGRRFVIGGAVLLFGFVVWSWASVSSLRDAYSAVEAQRAEIANQKERRKAIREQYGDQPDSLEKQAQLTGAENRLRVAVQRYNSAAAEYNRRAGSFPASIWNGLAGLPDRVPTADELDGGE